MYKSVYWNEPDGLRIQTSEELSKTYDDLHQYNAVHWNEPDGLRKPTPEELSKSYTDLGEYDGPVAWCEPDGLRRLTPEEESKQYNDLDTYAMPFTAPDSVLQAHEAAQQDRTVKGKVLAKKVEAPAENLTEKYEDLDKYGPVRWNEPDGLRMLTPEELSKRYEDLHLYGGAYQWHEPDGLRNLTPEEQSKRYRDVPQYVSRELAGESEWIHPEEASKNYKDLPKYKQYDNGDPAVPRVHPEESSKQYQDLSKYAQYGDAAPQYVQPEDASKQYNDFHMHPEESSKSYKDLGTYQPALFDSPLESFLLRPEEVAACQDLYAYNGGKPTILPDPVVYGSLKEFNTKAGSPFPDIGPFTYQGKANRLPPSSPESNVDDVDNLTAADIRAATLRRAGIVDETPSSEVREPEVKLTGNYARDFPEEFSASWSVDNSPSKSTLFPNNQGEDKEATAADEKNVDAELSSMDESFSSESGRLQPALDRQLDKLKETEDSYSHIPQGLETSFSEECDGKDTLPIKEHHFTPTQQPAGEPELYKILAYDSATQNITVAEATSSIQTETTPASLADVLTRLSTPSKFLPYFKSFEAQGYEVVSGSGDILIFRKVRAATEEASEPEPVPEPARRSMPINPIDMMGHPAVGNFASPTGFVNYDTLDGALEKPAPPFRNNDQDLKDPDLSGEKTKEHKKRNIGRKLALGTVWIAGSAYAVGVMAEYFKARGFEAEARPRRL